MNFQSLTRSAGTVIVTLLIASTAAFATAGGANGGGGGGEMCRNGALGWDDPGVTTTLLDFYEAENKLLPFRTKLNIPRSNLPVEVQVQDAIRKMKESNPDFAAAIEASYEHIRQPQHHDQRNMDIEPPTDTLEPFDGETCRRVGIGSYDDIDDVLDVSNDMYQMLDNTDKAGFWLHESVYRILRLGSGEDTSIEARLIVGHLFSDQPLEPVIAHRLTKSFMCSRPAVPGSDVGGVRFLLHTDGNITTLVPISYIQSGLPADQGGEFFWIPKQYVIDYKTSHGNFSDYSSEFFGELSQLLMNIGQPITAQALQIKPYGGIIQSMVNWKQVAGPTQLPTSQGQYTIPYRSQYYGAFLQAGPVESKHWVEHGSDANQTYVLDTPIVSSPEDYQNGIIKLTFDMSDDGGYTSKQRDYIHSGSPNSGFAPNVGDLSTSTMSPYTVTCREF